MKILIVGGGGREHAVGWACAKSPLMPDLFFAPGNGGTASLGVNLPIPAENVEGLINHVKRERFDLVIVGPEAPMVAGLCDLLTELGIPVFGPSAAAAQIEGSKAFSKQLMVEAGIPTARYESFTDYPRAEQFIQSLGAPCVVKASGLAAGKGAVVCMNIDEALRTAKSMLVEGSLGDPGRCIVVEEFLIGVEISMTAIVDREDFLLLPPARDHKAVFDGGTGPNTGGMGVVAPLGVKECEAYSLAIESVLKPLLKTLVARGTPFRGVIYPGLMLTDDGVKVLEVNARFGDPETEVLVPLFRYDLLEVMFATAAGRLGEWICERNLDPSDWRASLKTGAGATVILAAPGYPEKYPKGIAVKGLPLERDNTFVFHSGTQWNGDSLQTSGGRVLAVTGIGNDLREALETAYSAISSIQFDGMHYRRDIGRTTL